MSKKVVTYLIVVAFISGIAGFIIGISTPAVIAGDYDYQIVKQLKTLNRTLNSRLRRIESAIESR